VKTVAGRHRHVACHTKHALVTSFWMVPTSMTLNDLEWPCTLNDRGSYCFLSFSAPAHILKVNGAEITRDKRGQPTQHRTSNFINLNFDLLNLPYGGLKFGYSFKTHYYFIACCTRLPRWQNRCYRASRELCSNHLLFFPDTVYIHAQCRFCSLRF